MPVMQVEGVPRWFTYARHVWLRRRCLKVGRHVTDIACSRCGWCAPWNIAIVGRESGNVTVLSFLEFHSYDDAATWCVQMNTAHAETAGGDLTYYEPRVRR